MSNNKSLKFFFIWTVIQSIQGCGKSDIQQERPKIEQKKIPKPPSAPQTPEQKTVPPQNKDKQQDGGQNVGGGDPIKAVLFQARAKAVQLIDDVEPKNEALKSFFEINKEKLKTDILKSEHIWDKPKDAADKTEDFHKNFCGYTGFKEFDPINFKTPECAASIGSNIYAAAALLIHESLHHLGIKEETSVELYVSLIIPDGGINPKYHFFSRTESQGIVLNDQILFLGGVEKNKFYSIVSLTGNVIYDSVRRKWDKITQKNDPGALIGFSALYTGSDVLVFGGINKSSDDFPIGFCHSTNDGAKYNAEKDTWKRMSSENAPSKRFGHSAVWSGKEMIVWGGRQETGNLTHFASPDNKKNTIFLNDGAKYNPESDLWSEISSINQPSARTHHVSTWLNNKMVVWGGMSAAHKFGPFTLGHFEDLEHNVQADFMADGHLYDPEKNIWQPLPIDKGLPMRRRMSRTPHSYVVNGNFLYIVGGGPIMAVLNGLTFEWQAIGIPRLLKTVVTDLKSETYALQIEGVEKISPEWEVCHSQGKLLLFSMLHGFAGWSFDLVTNQWSAVSDILKTVGDQEIKVKKKGFITRELNQISAICLKDKVLVVAYHSPVASVMIDVYAEKIFLTYDVKENKWEIVEGLLER